MFYIHNILNRATELYAYWFAEWLHIHFVTRTAILLLIFWGILFIVTLLFYYIFGPLWVLFFRHVLFRLYNYLFVETPYEFIYIHFYSKDKPTLRRLYLRLSDKVKKNRLILNHTRYKGILYRGFVKRVTWTLATAVGITVTLWLTAFGLHQEYYVPALVLVEVPQNTETQSPDGEVPANNVIPNIPDESQVIVYPPGYINPTLWTDFPVILQLNENGINGARLRDKPGFDGTVIQMLWDDQTLEYLEKYTPDADVPGLYWLWVRTKDGQNGYIASHLIEQKPTDIN
jgi:hypothetical protein